MIKRLFLFGLVLWSVWTHAEPGKPNVIIVLTDDQGYGDLSCHGNPILKTPMLDRLAGESVRFTDFHVSSICTPTRSQLLTGKDACRNGAFAWAYSREIIHTDIPVMPEIFRENGYATGHFGKWHLGDNYPFRPMDRGFDESIKHGGASIFQTPDYWDNDYMDDHYEHNGVMKQYKGYCTDVWFGEAKNFILESVRQGKPFFVYLPTNAPHGPYIVQQNYSLPYLKELKKGYDPVEEFALEKRTPEVISWFYGMISNIDENMGKLDIFLEKNQLFDNTIMVFMTDNGGTAGSRVYNAGMRGRKASLYEGGHRVPLFIRWPGGDMKPVDIDDLTQIQDLFPTLVDLCGLECTVSCFDGISLEEKMRKQSAELPDRILVMQNARAPEARKYDATVMWNKWRLVKYEELYHIGEDPQQQKNVADKHPDLVRKMQNHYETWWEGVQESLNRVPHIPVGDDLCGEVTLTCFDWHGAEGKGNVTVQPDIRKGSVLKGSWNIEALEEGEYEIRCSRWPEEARTPMVEGLPPHKTLTITYPEGKALPIASTLFFVDGVEREVDVTDSDLYSKSTFRLSKGKHTVQATFHYADRKYLTGAYYARIRKLSGTEPEAGYTEPKNYGELKIHEFSNLEGSDTRRFQDLVNTLSKNGGGIIRIKASNDKYYLGGIEVTSNVHIRMEPEVHIRQDPTLKSVNVFTLLGKDISIVGASPEQKAVIATSGGGPDHPDITSFRAVGVFDVNNFLLANISIEENNTRFSTIMTKNTAVNGTIENITMTGAGPGWGLLQMQGGSNIIARNLDGQGGFTLRLEQGSATAPVGIQNLKAKNITGRHGRAAVLIAPKSKENGYAVIEDVASYGCQWAVLTSAGKEGGVFKKVTIKGKVIAHYDDQGSQFRTIEREVRNTPFLPPKLQKKVSIMPGYGRDKFSTGPASGAIKQFPVDWIVIEKSTTVERRGFPFEDPAIVTLAYFKDMVLKNGKRTN